MTPLFPSIESPEFAAAFDQVVRGIDELHALFDRYNARRHEGAAVDEQTIVAFDEITNRYNALIDELRAVDAYLHAFVTTNSRDDLAQSRNSELEQHTVQLRQLRSRYTAWIGSLDVEALTARSTVAKEHAFPLWKAARAAQHQMGEAEENLAALLSLSGGIAWNKLHGNVTSQLTVPVHFPESVRGPRSGRTEELPMSAVRGLAYDADPEVRRVAYEAEVQGWERAAVPLAAAMNGVKGEGQTLNARRGWRDSLDPSLFLNNIDRETLDAMHVACRESFPDFRRYLQAKARLLGKEQLPWWDLFAPVGGDQTRAWEWNEASRFVVDQFGTYSGKMADLAGRAVQERWIDAEARDGKRDGAFCMSVRRDESRVLMNFKPSFGSVSTLAHELGHAYHNLNLARRTPLQRETPMALAETASIFCQTIVANAALEELPGAERLTILEGELQSNTQVVVDIHSRFLVEQRVFERRRQRELAVRELNELMLQAQRETYGDGLDSGTLHRYMWAMKPHYYYATRPYYNWPYTFGQLFGFGLYARYQEDPEAFRAGYDELLSRTGMDSAADLAARFGIDIRSVDFWRSSLDVCREQIREFESLAAQEKEQRRTQ
jgi:oligoendopeptidase F